jgi:hypothetical protein
MYCPKEPAIVVDAVLEIKCQVFKEKQEDPISVYVFNPKKMVLITPHQYANIKKPTKEKVEAGIYKSQVNVFNAVFDGIKPV